MKLSDFDLIEINEAFAAQVIACQRAAESKEFGRTRTWTAPMHLVSSPAIG